MNGEWTQWQQIFEEQQKTYKSQREKSPNSKIQYHNFTISLFLRRLRCETTVSGRATTLRDTMEKLEAN